MKLTEHKINEFINVLSSDAPAPGGGSASALAGSVAIALTAMVANLTVDKEKYKENKPLMEEIIRESTVLKKNLLNAIDEDTEAYNKVTDVFKMPKETEEDKKLRKEAMQNALKYATKAPFEIMKLSFDGIKLTEKAIGKSNTNAISDLGVSALNFKSALQGAWLNVLINLSSINDADFVKQYQKDGTSILQIALPICDKIYTDVLNSLS